MADQELANAVADAAKQIQEEAPKEEPKVEEVGEGESESAEEIETPEGENPDLTPEQIEESKNLYKALSGPQAAAIIAALAQQAGILPKSGETPTKTEIKEGRREIQDIVKEALGPEYAFLSDRIGRIFDQVSAQQRAETQSQLHELQQANIEREVVTAYERLATDTKGESKKFESRMASLSEEIPIGNMNIRTYMQRLYTIASSEKKAVAPQKVADQIRKNANDVPSRLKSGPSPEGNNGMEFPSKKMSLDESIKWAMGQMEKGKR